MELALVLKYVYIYVYRKTIPNIFSNISREYHVKEVDKAKGINSNLNSDSYCRQDNY